MVAKQVLSQKEYREIIAVNFIGKEKYDSDYEYLEEWFEYCKYWLSENQLIGINHFLSFAIEQFENENLNSNELLEWVYNLENSHNFRIGVGGVEFTENFLKQCEIYPNLDLESKLIKTQYLSK